MNDKTKSIETSPEKASIRNDIVSQNLQNLVRMEKLGKHISTINGLTLPAKKWFFEHNFINHIGNAFFLANKPQVHFYGVEKEAKFIDQTFKNMPQSCHIVKGMLHEFIDNEVQFKTNGVGQILDTPRRVPIIFDFYWADYCLTPNMKNIEQFVQVLNNNIKHGLAYITFSLNLRGRKEGFQNEFSCYDKNKLIAVVNAINRCISKNVKGKKVNLTYKVLYAGGESERTPMITIGFSVGIPANAIRVIDEDRMTKKRELKSHRANFVNKLQNNTYKTAMQDHRGRPRKSAKKIITPEQIRLEAAVTRWESKWDSLKGNNEKKAKIAAKYGVSLHSFGSMIACRHGKFVEKRLAKIRMAA